MIRWIRTARIVPGKEAQAMQWAKGIVDWFNKKYGGHLSVYTDCFGEVGTVRWFDDLENLAAIETRREKLMADQEYLQRVSQVPSLFQSGVFDTVMFSL